MLASRIRKLEILLDRRRPRRQFIVYENDWRQEGLDPIEPPPAPGADILRIRYVKEWPPAWETVAPKAEQSHARVERGAVAAAEVLRGS